MQRWQYLTAEVDDPHATVKNPEERTWRGGWHSSDGQGGFLDAVPRKQDNPYDRTQWFHLTIAPQMNRWGEEGWELVGAVSTSVGVVQPVSGSSVGAGFGRI